MDNDTGISHMPFYIAVYNNNETYILFWIAHKSTTDERKTGVLHFYIVLHISEIIFI